MNDEVSQVEDIPVSGMAVCGNVRQGADVVGDAADYRNADS